MNPRLHNLLTSAVRNIMSPLLTSNSFSAYNNWSRDALIERLIQLEAKTSIPSSSTSKTPSKIFNFSAHSRRKIALKFCYAGWDYNGLTFQNDKTLLPTVEETLFFALAKARLIDPEAGPQGCEWERCGRTDVGVSAAGQVISLWVRSNLTSDAPTVSKDSLQDHSRTNTVVDPQDEVSQYDSDAVDDDLPLVDEEYLNFADQTNASLQSMSSQEIRYVSILNRLLPSTIRIIAWSPVTPSFSARFACKYRHYKYFFSPQSLNISAMQNAAQRLVGEHDFRNLCKLDPSKQLTNFRRKILSATISSTSIFPSTLTSETPLAFRGLYVFDLIGTAFLWHQVRHIMAILFLVGCGLEPPSVINALLYTDVANPINPFDGDEPCPIVARKPEYQMADALPLMLWECAYAEEEVLWRTDESSSEDDTSNVTGLANQSEIYSNNSERNLFMQMHSIHSRALIHTVLDAHFFEAVCAHHPPMQSPLPITRSLSDNQSITEILTETAGTCSHLMVPIGGGLYRRYLTQNYVPLLQRKRFISVEDANQRWLSSKGSRKPLKQAVETDDDDE